MARDTYLYRCWNDRGELLYTGITSNLQRRLEQHERRSSWWPEVRNVTWELWPSRTEALWAEWVSIVAEQPRHNRHLIRAGLPLPRPRSAAARVVFRLAMRLGDWGSSSSH